MDTVQETTIVLQVVEAPQIPENIINADGIDYIVTFAHNGRMTACVVTWRTKYAGWHSRTGLAFCNPTDVYDQAFGEKLAMRRACRIESCGARRALWSAWRKSLRG